MKREEVAKHDGKARSSPSINEEHTFIHPEYEIILQGKLGNTGPLVIARLKPKGTVTRILPPFIFRWDEKANSLDVDPVNVSKAKTKRFEKGTSNYYGHSTVKLASGPRVFAANIRWDGQLIYQGQIRFNLARPVKFKVALVLNTSAKDEH